jgi:hypothetical protein
MGIFNKIKEKREFNKSIRQEARIIEKEEYKKAARRRAIEAARKRAKKRAKARYSTPLSQRIAPHNFAAKQPKARVKPKARVIYVEKRKAPKPRKIYTQPKKKKPISAWDIPSYGEVFK